MAGNAENDGRWPGSRWRRATWGAAVVLILLPWVAMQITDEVDWDLADFAVASVLVVGVGVIYELGYKDDRQ